MKGLREKPGKAWGTNPGTTRPPPPHVKGLWDRPAEGKGLSRGVTHLFKGLAIEQERQGARQLDMAGLAGLGGLQVAVKGQALLAVQAGSGGGLGQVGGPHSPIKEAHQHLTLRNRHAATCEHTRVTYACTVGATPSRSFMCTTGAHAAALSGESKQVSCTTN